MKPLSEKEFTEKLHTLASTPPTYVQDFEDGASSYTKHIPAILKPLSHAFTVFTSTPRTIDKSFCRWLLCHLDLLKIHHVPDLVRLYTQWGQHREYKNSLCVTLWAILIKKFETDRENFEDKLELSSEFFSEEAVIKTKEYHAAQIEFILANDPVAHFGFSPQRCVELAMRYKDLLSLNISVCSYLKDKECQKLANKCTELESLTLSHYESLLDKSLASIGKLKKLRYLRLGGCPEVTNLGVEAISHLSHLETLQLHHLDNVDGTGIKPLLAMPALADASFESFPLVESIEIEQNNDKLLRLSLINTGLHSHGLRKLAHLTQIQHLSLAASKKLQDDSLSPLPLLKTLQSLDLSNCQKFTASASKTLAQLHSVNSLKLGWTKIQDDFLPSIGQMQNLRHLDLKGCDRLTQTGFALLKNLHNLETLDLQWTNVNSSAIQELTHSMHIKTLKLDNCPVLDNHALNAIQHKEHLHYLSLTGSHFVNKETIRIIRQMTQLKHLVLTDCISLNANDLINISALKNLEALQLQGCLEIMDEGLKALANMPNLQSLDLTYCTEITDEGIVHLAKLPNLKTLKLSWTQITDKGLSYLSKIVNLNALDLSYCKNITDLGLVHLGKLAYLESLNIMNCPQVTISGKKYLFSVLSLESMQRNFVFSPLYTKF